MSEETVEQRTVREALERVEGPPPAPKPMRKSSWVNLLVDYGPLLVFFAAYNWFKPKDGPADLGVVVAVIKGTIAFMIATVFALTISKWRLGRVSPMLWLSTALVLGFGGLTVYFHDGVWIQRKPTAAYLLFGISLLGGVWKGKALLKYLLEAAFEGLNDEGWLKLSRNWGWFFLFMAVLNEVLRQVFNQENGNFGTWLSLKIWLFGPMSFLFTFTQIPMLLRHGLGAEGAVEVETTPPQG